MIEQLGFRAGEPPEWNLEQFLHGDEVQTALITLERNRRTFAWKCADIDAEGMTRRIGVSSVTLGGLLKHLAWVEELYFQDHLFGRPAMSPFGQRDLEADWEEWVWRTAADDTPDDLRALWHDAVHRSRDSLADALSEGLDRPTHDGMNVRRLIADMIEEYARHTGHADLLRESIDGSTGEGPPRSFPIP